MWSKGPFKSRLPIRNPTLADKTSGNLVTADPVPVGQYAKDLPALPYDSTISLSSARNDQPTAPLPFAGKTYEKKQFPGVSPPVSPELGPQVRDSGSSFCVSPIEDSVPDQDLQHEQWGYGVAAPVLSRAVHTGPSPSELLQSAPKTIQLAPSGDGQAARWDAYPGEPTQSNVGRPGQVEPRNPSFHKLPGSHATNFLHWGREQFQAKKKLDQARSRISSFSKDENRVPETRDRSGSRVLAEHSINKDAISHPQNPNLGFVPTVVTTITAGDPSLLPERPATEHAYTIPRLEEADTEIDTAIDKMVLSGTPPSHSGAPYVAMRTGSANGNPGDSPRASLALISQSSEDLPASIMSRRRPVPISMRTSKKPVRKPTPSEAAQEPTLTNQQQPDDAPKDTIGRIEAFEARRDELAKRRFNLETVIHELTRVIQPGSIAYDLAAKAEVKRSVQSIDNEIAEIKREEHELGLKITRAWRKLDERENHGDGSNLWVKRVTS